MNVKQVIALAAFAFAGTAAMADDITIANEQFVARKSRAEVQAELVQARQNGTLPRIGEVDTTLPMAVQSTVTRDQVRAELRNARSMKFVAYPEAA